MKADMILFPSAPSDITQPDVSFALEVEAAKAAGFRVGFVNTSRILFGERDSSFWEEEAGLKDSVLYRGWLLPEEAYRQMSHALILSKRPHVTSLSEYLACYHFPRWYKDIGGSRVTPYSYWITELKDLDHVAICVSNVFRHSALILKDFVKSRKHEWFDACYISQASDIEEVKRVTGNFIERQGKDLVEGLVFREFINFKRIGTHSKSSLPLINEHRFFVYHGKPFYQAPYWFEGDYSGPVPSPDVLRDIVDKVCSPFFAVDVAEKEAGGWVVVEVNDGGSAGVPEGGSVQDFYIALRQAQLSV